MNLIVDSSAYIDLLRNGVDVRQRLVSFLRSGTLYNCGVIRAEVLRGLRFPAARDGMEAFFDIIPEIPSDSWLWRQVAGLGWELGRKGQWPPVTDLVIAASALRVGAALVTLNSHFEGIPRLKTLPEIP